jgi:hypothetical protein
MKSPACTGIWVRKLLSVFAVGTWEVLSPTTVMFASVLRSVPGATLPT